LRFLSSITHGFEFLSLAHDSSRVAREFECCVRGFEHVFPTWRVLQGSSMLELDLAHIDRFLHFPICITELQSSLDISNTKDHKDFQSSVKRTHQIQETPSYKQWLYKREFKQKRLISLISRKNPPLTNKILLSLELYPFINGWTTPDYWWTIFAKQRPTLLHS